jgi:hypothetical protein
VSGFFFPAIDVSNIASFVTSYSSICFVGLMVLLPLIPMKGLHIDQSQFAEQRYKQFEP